MDPYISDWLNLLVRWGHLVAGIAWIGTSFYFVALDFSLKNREGLPDGVYGEAWEVHGGGFYHVQKYLSAPPSLPDHLIWFKWEAYLTWVSGFLLLTLQYYLNADAYLIDPAVMALTPVRAVGLSLAALLVGWIVYNAMCKALAITRPKLLAGLVFALILGAAWGFIGTMMAANVFAVIIPNQRKITAALLRGEKPDPRFGAEGKQRSQHNTYLTLPVLFMMLSNHYPMITQHPNAWAIVGLIVVGGAAMRHFLLRHEVGDPIGGLAWTFPVIGGALVAALWMTEPAPTPAFTGVVADETALAIVQARCSSCHAAAPTDPTVKQAPKGVMLETLEELKRHGQQVMIQAVNSKAMPMGNKTGMTDEERGKLGAWLRAQP
jgi:uncharacterized membrane protein